MKQTERVSKIQRQSSLALLRPVSDDEETSTSSNKVDDSTEFSFVKVNKLPLLGPEKVNVSGNVAKSIVSHVRGFLGRSAFPVLLNYRGGFTTTAGTAYNTVIGINPALSSEISAFATLFDEMRLKAVDFKAWHIPILSTSSSPSFTTLGALAYDPTGSGVLTGVANALIHTRHKMLTPLYGLGADQGISINTNCYECSPQVSWRFTIPKGPHTSASGTYVGMWISTSDSTDNFGWIKPYIESLGTGIQLSFQYIITFEMEFRSRS
jgi:hypothetical protein